MLSSPPEINWCVHSASKSTPAIVDVSETQNIAAQHPEIVDRMKAAMASWQKSVSASNRGDDYKK
ncbi:MAG: hypothetical protein QGH15_09000 [Kiritimatiellia bacterium]|jgi:hypothetical protein|nr:hypothetical protein [Kiritimatiellia bacterium]